MGACGIGAWVRASRRLLLQSTRVPEQRLCSGTACATAGACSHMQLYSKATQIKIAIAKNNSNTLISDSARDTLSTLNENLFQGHTTNNSYISYKFEHSRKCSPRDTQMWITADRAGSDRMAVSDLGARYGWSRDRSSRQPWLPGPVAPRLWLCDAPRSPVPCTRGASLRDCGAPCSHGGRCLHCGRWCVPSAR